MLPDGSRGVNRRDFLKQTSLSALGAGLALEVGSLACAQEAAPRPRIEKRGKMVYRRLGRTNLMVSELAVGGSPSPEAAIFSEALDRGMNLVDSSVSYAGGEERIGEVVAGRRDEVVISTKCHVRDPAGARAEVVAACEAALGRLKTDHLDIWCVHGIANPSQFLNEEVQAAFDQLKQQGKTRFAGVSCHTDPVGVLTPLIESGKLDVAILAFNVFSGNTVRPEDVKAGKVYDNWLADSGLQGVLDLAHQHDVGLIAMKTMSGGALQKLETFQAGGSTLAQAKLKWVLSHEAIAAALSEVVSYTILEENLGTVGQTLTPQDQARLREHVRTRSASVCRLCGRCQRTCPAGVPIPDLLRCLVYRDTHGRPELAREAYREIAATHRVADCGDCTRCAPVCPHGVNVPEGVARARRVLA